MMQPRRVFVALIGGLLVSLAVVAIPAGAASAAVPTPRYWVSPSAVAGAPNKQCSDAGYVTVQSAVNAAETFEVSNGTTPEPIIEVCSGTYIEQVTVTNSLKFADPDGTGSATIELPANVGGDQSLGLSTTNCQLDDSSAGIQVPQSVVEVCAADSSGNNTSGVSVSITGINIEGSWGNGVCYDSLYDVLVGGGAALALADSTVSQAGAYPPNGCQGGVGVQVGNSSTSQIGTATLTDDVVETYQKNGITIDGAGSSATIAGTTVTGQSQSVTAQNGIQVSDGATGAISRSTVTGNQCTLSGVCGADPWSDVQSCGVILFDEAVPTSVVTSTITDNDVGICNVQGSSSGTPVLIQGNIVSGGDESVYQDSGSSTIKDNSLTGANIGIWIPQYSGQPSSPTVTATGNVITGQASAGVQVESDGTSGDEAVVASITKSDLSGDPFGVENNSSSIVNATNDFWGDASGPSGNSFGTSTNSAVDVNVTFFPWDETTSDTPTTATVKTQKGCTSSGTNLKSSKADAVICLTGAGAAITYHGIGPVLILGNGSDDITLGSSGNPASGVSIILSAGSSVVVANSSAGVYQLQNGATATFTDGSNLTQASSPLVTG